MIAGRTRRNSDPVPGRGSCRAASPDRYRPDLAISLANLGIRLWALGRPAEALPPAEEAVAVYRELATATQEIYTHEDREAQHAALTKISRALRIES